MNVLQVEDCQAGGGAGEGRGQGGQAITWYGFSCCLYVHSVGVDCGFSKQRVLPNFKFAYFDFVIKHTTEGACSTEINEPTCVWANI